MNNLLILIGLIYLIYILVKSVEKLVEKNKSMNPKYIEEQQKAAEIQKRNKIQEQERNALIAKEKSDRLAREEEKSQKELWDRNKDLIKKFLQIAERKVSIIDDYGDDNWEALPYEIVTCMKKIAQCEKIDMYISFKKNLFSSYKYKWLYDELENTFRRYHAEHQNRSSMSFDFSKMSGIEFESWIVKLLKENGFDDVRGTPTTGDQGADIIALKGVRHIIIQAKRYNGSVGNKAVQEVISAMQYYGGNEGWVITNSIFTKSAIALAQKSKIRLIDGRALTHIEDFIN